MVGYEVCKTIVQENCGTWLDILVFLIRSSIWSGIFSWRTRAHGFGYVLYMYVNERMKTATTIIFNAV